MKVVVDTCTPCYNDTYDGVPRVVSQQELKRRLLDGALSPMQLLEEVDKIDQSTSDRKAAEENMRILEDTEVVARITNEEELWDYFNLLSLTYLHVDQRRLSDGLNEAATQCFQKALDAADKVHGDEGCDQWRLYTAAWLFFSKQDVEELERISKLMQGDDQQGMLDIIQCLSFKN